MAIRVSMSVALMLCGSLLLAMPASAGTEADLGGKLTPIGAEKAGNADGTIPVWDGGITIPPAGYESGGDYVDPYADDKKLFSITKENINKYRDKLSAGQILLLDRYPDYRMDVYPTQRSCAYPESVYKKTKENMGVARVDGTTHDLVDAVPGGFPFPIPTSGDQIIWNHRSAYEGIARKVVGSTAVIDKAGGYTPLVWDEFRLSNYYDPAHETLEYLDNRQLSFLSSYIAPARHAGEIDLVP